MSTEPDPLYTKWRLGQKAGTPLLPSTLNFELSDACSTLPRNGALFLDRFTLARLMGHSSPRVAERYYIHVTEPHVTAGFERFQDYLAERQIESFAAGTETVQGGASAQKGGTVGGTAIPGMPITC